MGRLPRYAAKGEMREKRNKRARRKTTKRNGRQRSRREAPYCRDSKTPRTFLLSIIRPARHARSVAVGNVREKGKSGRKRKAGQTEGKERKDSRTNRSSKDSQGSSWGWRSNAYKERWIKEHELTAKKGKGRYIDIIKTMSISILHDCGIVHCQSDCSHTSSMQSIEGTTE